MTLLIGNAPDESARPPLLRPAAMGIITIAVFFGGFGLWAALAPLASAVLASGVVILDSSSKTVQHLEGGIINQIHVREGQQVAAGDLLVVLSNIQSKAAWEVLNIRYLTGLAERARLITERDGGKAVKFPKELRGNDQISKELRNGQNSIFKSRRLSIRSQTKILKQRIAQLKEQITGLLNGIDAQHRQASLYGKEIESIRSLVAKGFGRKLRLVALEREAAEVDREIAESMAEMARAEQQIGETRLRINDIRVRLLNEATAKLRDVDEIVLNARERLVASRDVLRRTEVRAPVDGQVMELAVSTIGGVVQPSQPLLTIVPINVPIVVEALVKPTDIDDVHPGQPAQVRLSAFNFRTTPLLVGKVESVSADAMEDARSGALFYKARVRLPVDAAQTLGQDRTIVPGMPAEVQIQTATRTLLDYMLSPILAQLEISFLEK
ncbi:MAG: HlyD family type I secretion periplasmic adaptor subunit [Rhodospirillaceae bacterium]|jgi:HlyD family type I secretion membrane fusion protein|nr:HlyD family type I secretion periplasmic adaptor subunit [Rhodospirillaceae bacterium]MBT4487941.1 HlyD family type I secretion periplasmic adaptor subunit [Rhodospirillaceae bacterium]MBT5195002.1 HlyD family type I secretion periplasmic adaptor subunit [Rhodospirillaceae bacterium]MBT5898169.1 HlyD family type I secretion periplasmic adaptor subunit [Rhodospirillaceae bacterium]MBT6430130.1 HlyD family type I secretion periplasmic adaptor subunit [Rhodospirillaceae bacterium]